MKDLTLLFILLILWPACHSAHETGDAICNCYQMFAEEVDRQGLNFEAADIETQLMQTYEQLISNKTAFKPCTDNSIFDGDLFSRSKLRIYSSMNPDCVDPQKLQRIANHGPLIYKAM